MKESDNYLVRSKVGTIFWVNLTVSHPDSSKLYQTGCPAWGSGSGLISKLYQPLSFYIHWRVRRTKTDICKHMILSLPDQTPFQVAKPARCVLPAPTSLPLSSIHPSSSYNPRVPFSDVRARRACQLKPPPDPGKIRAVVVGDSRLAFVSKRKRVHTASHTPRVQDRASST